jgi:hypothetical protein
MIFLSTCSDPLNSVQRHLSRSPSVLE